MTGLAKFLRERLADLVGDAPARGEFIEITKKILHRSIDHFDVVFAQPVAQRFIAAHVARQVTRDELLGGGERTAY